MTNSVRRSGGLIHLSSSSEALTKAINRLRESLADSAEKPKFIETLPRRGYRFIAQVERNIRSLAVLPLQNLSGDPNREHWADGITDEMITHVAKIVDLRSCALRVPTKARQRSRVNWVWTSCFKDQSWFRISACESESSSLTHSVTSIFGRKPTIANWAM